VTAFLHLLGADSVIGADVVVDDIVAVDGADAAHVVVAGEGAVDDEQRQRLAHRLLPTRGPATSTGLRDVLVISGLQQLLRALRTRHGTVALHAHGAHARTIATVLAGVDTTLIVDDGDDRPGHRLLPAPTRICFTSHGDLDRALEAGLLPRRAALTAPGIDRAVAGVRHDVVIVDGLDRAVVAALEDAGVHTSAWTAHAAHKARAVVVGAEARCSPALAAAVACGTPCFALGVPWAADLARCAAFSVLDPDDGVDALIDRVLDATPKTPRQLPKALGRAARTKALLELYEGLGPAPMRAPMGRPRRRR